MSAKEGTIRYRLEQFQRTLWFRQEARDWYGFDPLDSVNFLSVFTRWALLYKKELTEICGKTYKGTTKDLGLEELPKELVKTVETWKNNSLLIDEPIMDIFDDENYEWINRNLLELFFQRKEIVPLRQASIMWSMAEESLEAVINAYENSYPTLSSGIRYLNYRNIFHKEGLDRLWMFLRKENSDNKIGGDLNTFAKKLHSFVKKTFDIDVAAKKCATSEILSEGSNVDTACEYDILSNEPMGLRYQIFLRNQKPIQLKPDAFSFRTYACHMGLISKSNLLSKVDMTNDQELKLQK